MIPFEQALVGGQKVAVAVRESADRVRSQAKALEKAAATGNIAALKRCQERLAEFLARLEQDVANARACWSLTEEEEERFFHEDYVDALKSAASDRGLQMYERDGLLMCYPSIVRILAADRAVQVDRKKVSTVRPSYLVELLLKNQKKTSGFKPPRFLESLYAVYTDIRDGSGSDQRSLGMVVSTVVPLRRIYDLMTALPGAKREYGTGDFARDLYVLECEGPRVTRSGAAVSFPSSTGTRRRSGDVFSFIGPDGNSAEYYGIRFERDK